jgi:hypothetical protein
VDAVAVAASLFVVVVAVGAQPFVAAKEVRSTMVLAVLA